MAGPRLSGAGWTQALARGLEAFEGLPRPVLSAIRLVLAPMALDLGVWRVRG